MIEKILILLIYSLLFIAAFEDFKTGEVKTLYPLSIGLLILGVIFSLYSKNPLINIKGNLIFALIIFISNYLIYVITNITNRNGWGGADVLILSSLTCSIGPYIIFVLLISTGLALIYSIIKAIYTKEKIINITTRFLPFVFIANIFSIFFVF